MSLILDALKKSEAERQRGQAPGLFVEQAPLSRTRHEGLPAWAWALGALMVAVLAVFGWREWSRAAGDRDAAATTNAPSPAPEAAAREARVDAPTEMPADVATTAPARTDIAPPRPTPAPAAASRPADTPPPATPAQPRPAPTPAPTPAPPPAPTAVAVPAGTDALPRLADLPAGERAALPPLKLTMHVYADDPAARFVILDGRRLGEGGLLGDTVVVREIRRDGVVLEAQGRALLLPRP